jgi:hypothetical protein
VWLRNGHKCHAILKAQQRRNFPLFPESHHQQQHQNRKKAELFDALCYLCMFESEDVAAARPA